jgi:hypothetical protein
MTVKKTEAEKKPQILRPDVKIHDERLLLPTGLIAHAFGVSLDAVIKWGIKPVRKKHREALLYLPEIIGNRMGFGEGGVQKLNPAQEKALLDKTRRERAEIELRKEREEIVDIKDVLYTLEKELVEVRQKLLALPNRLARVILLAKDAQEAQDVIAGAVHDTLKGLTYGGKLSFGDSPSNRDDAKAPAAPNGSGMGGQAQAPI